MEEENDIPESQLLVTLNNYKEFQTLAGLEKVKQYLQSKKLPVFRKYTFKNEDNETITVTAQQQRERFIKKFQDFVFQDDKIVYKNDDVTLIVVYPNERDDIIKKYYNDKTTGLGSGIQNLYNKITQQYLNISRDEVELFLKKQPFYQMTRPLQKVVNRPIVDAPFPNMRWAIDLIEMSQYLKYKKESDGSKVAVEGANFPYVYILSIIDFASRYCWARPLKNKSANEVATTLLKVFEETNTRPLVIQADGGKEFGVSMARQINQGYPLGSNGNIQIIYTKSYSPQSNGLVENLNAQIRKMLRDAMNRNVVINKPTEVKAPNWIKYLPDVITNKNNTKNGTTKKRPIDVWHEGLKRTFEEYQDEKKLKSVRLARENLLKEAQRSLNRYKDAKEYKKGDLVRVKMTTLYSKLRRLVKENPQNEKLFIATFTPEIYVISRVITNQATFPLGDGIYRPKVRYLISPYKKPNQRITKNNDLTLALATDGENRVVGVSGKQPMMFFASDFMPVSKENVIVPSTNKALLLKTDYYNNLGIREFVEGTNRRETNRQAARQQRTAEGQFEAAAQRGVEQAVRQTQQQANPVPRPLNTLQTRQTGRVRRPNQFIGDGIMIGGQVCFLT